MTSTDDKPVRCRFAPSPTGYLHLGGARTALFNYLFAKSHNGTHILRIEDTDRERSTTEATDAILRALEWLGIGYDEGPYYQSQRLGIYREYARKLLNSGHAYPCSCDKERIDEVRSKQRIEGRKPQYDRLHRPAEPSAQASTLPSAEQDTPFVIRLRVPENGVTTFSDLVLGEIRTNNEEIDDFIIFRSDGTPTYNFTVVVDDIEMLITHIIRGMDHVSNTSKQLVIYELLGVSSPQFAHVPMILGQDKKKLSKRHGATSVTDYRKDGYLPDAFINYLARLGWSYGDKEIFTRQELETLFSIKNIGKSPAVFDFDKLLWVNTEHLKMLSASALSKYIVELLKKNDFRIEGLAENKTFIKLIESLQERTKTLNEMADACHWFLLDDNSLTIEEKAFKKHLKPSTKEPLLQLIEELNDLETLSEQNVEETFHKTIKTFGIKLGKLAQPVRVAVTGSSISPPIYTVLELLGKERSIARLQRAIHLIGNETQAQ